MSAQILLLDRVEFAAIKVIANAGDFAQHPGGFPQLADASTPPRFLTRSDLFYTDDQVQDPRVLVLSYGIKVDDASADGTPPQPYSIEIEALGYFRYIGGDEFVGAERFRAVRFSGYQILYGAIREMVANLTARGRHGLWHLPARNFGAVAKERAEQDEAERQRRLAGSPLIMEETPAAIAKRRPAAKAAGAKRTTGSRKTKDLLVKTPGNRGD